MISDKGSSNSGDSDGAAAGGVDSRGKWALQSLE